MNHNFEDPFLPAENNEDLTTKQVFRSTPAHSLCMLTTNKALNNEKHTLTNADRFIC
jgi:hypothetical protein